MIKYNNLVLAISCIILVACSNQNIVFVSMLGDEAGNGTKEHPFLGIEKARDFIRERRQSGENKPFSILLREGDYYFTRTLKFKKEDQALTIAPYNNEKVRFVGGISISPNEAMPVVGSDKEKLFPEKNRANILMVQLNRLGIAEYGNLHQVGFKHPEAPIWMELFINRIPFFLSRWPNDSTVAIGEIIHKGSIASEGDNGNMGGKFTYSVTRPTRWKASDDIWLFGYFKYGWADDAIKLASVDTIGKTFTTAQPHRYGFDTGNPWNRWYAYNIPEEIDALGEYYIDRKEGILYFYNPGNIETIEVSVLE